MIVANTKALHNLREIEKHLEPFGEVFCGRGAGMVSIVGEGYDGSPAMAMRFLSALQDCGPEVSINRQTQALKCSYWVSVSEYYVQQFAKNAYHKFFGKFKGQPVQVEC